MPTFNSVEALKKEILKRMKTALEYAEFDTQKFWWIIPEDFMKNTILSNI